MRTLLLVTSTSSCALIAWMLCAQPTSAGRAPIIAQVSQPNQTGLNAPQFSAVAEAKREEAALAQCDAKAAQSMVKQNDREAFIERCLLAVDLAEEGHKP